jgi:hypothetical protein
MEIEIADVVKRLPVERAWSVSIVIKSFKGRRDVEVHLFRPRWDPREEGRFDWDKLLGDPIHPDADCDLMSCRKLVLECFTPKERDRLVDYLRERYGEKLAAIRACPIDFPVPLGLVALSDLSEGKDIGFIHFEKIPNYPLPFGVRGFFDLSQHPPLVEVEEQ